MSVKTNNFKEAKKRIKEGKFTTLLVTAGQYLLVKGLLEKWPPELRELLRLELVKKHDDRDRRN